MILHPEILALVVSSLLTCLMTLYAVCHGAVILRRWDLASGSASQLALERRTYLVSTALNYLIGFQLVSLLLFIRTADAICHLFVGAMCAVGTLTANPYGYPALLLKSVTFIMASLWLILNHADSLGYDYPLLRPKYIFLLLLAPLLVAESALQGLYFAGLQPDLITSCCGALFSQASRGIANEIVAVPGGVMKVLFHACMAAMFVAGVRFCRNGKGAYLLSALSCVTFIVSIMSIISFISLHIYEMPSHHCPFCILQKEYGYVGYPMYLLLFSGVVSGLGGGLLQPFRGRESLAKLLPGLQRRLMALSVLSFFLFYLVVSWRMAFSALRQGSY